MYSQSLVLSKYMPCCKKTQQCAEWSLIFNAANVVIALLLIFLLTVCDEIHSLNFARCQPMLGVAKFIDWKFMSNDCFISSEFLIILSLNSVASPFTDALGGNDLLSSGKLQ